MGALRSTLDRLFDQYVARSTPRHRGALFAALAVPAIVTGLVVTVHPGNTLSGLAAQYCHGQVNDWTGIYQANRATIGANPNLILPGQKLAIKCDDPKQLLALGSSGVGSSQPTSNQSGPSVGSAPAPAPVAVTYTGSGAMQQCIISRESGGQVNIWNASGHYGLYQFSAGTWAASGGNPADFGNASAAEQTQVFYNAVAARGYSDWAPYDGC
jgi:hypothetical protein